MKVDDPILLISAARAALVGAGLLGEMMSGAFNTIGFSWIGSPAATELETVCCFTSYLLPRQF